MDESEEVEDINDEAAKLAGPSWVGFLKLEAVRKLLDLLRVQKMFSMGEIKRAMRTFLAIRPDMENIRLGV